MTHARHPTVTFSPEKREEFRAAYNQAVADHVDTFSFEGHLYVTAFAKYVLEYLDTPSPTP